MNDERTDPPLTPPIQAGNTIIGAIEAEVMPFEPAGIDYSTVNERRKHDPAYGSGQVPDAIVNSCSQCCMSVIDSKPNILGRMHRKLVKSCSQCPVGKAADRLPARDGSGAKLFVREKNGAVRPMTQSELVQMETDGTA